MQIQEAPKPEGKEKDCLKSYDIDFKVIKFDLIILVGEG